MLAAAACACSLDGLADGGASGGGGAATGGAATGGAPVGGAGGSGLGGSDGAGGSGGAASAFEWIRSFGNGAIQGTSPVPTDAGAGSTLRISDVGPSGDVWVVAATKGSIDFDGDGPEPARGNPASANVFAAHLDDHGGILHLLSFDGELADIDDAVTVSSVLRFDDDSIAIAGSFKGGILHFDDTLSVTQTSQSSEDAFVVRVAADGTVQAARQIGGANAQTARAMTRRSGELFVAGKLKRALAVTNPADGVKDTACSFSANTEDFERVMVLELDAQTLTCSRLLTAAGLETSSQQAFAITTDSDGVYVGGSYTRQIEVPSLAAMVSTSGEDGFVIAFDTSGVPVPRWIARASSNHAGASDGVRALVRDGASLWVAGSLDQGTTVVDTVDLSVGVVDANPADDCPLPTTDDRDGFVAMLDPLTGACQGATLIGADFDDEVRWLSPRGGGVLAAGYTTVGIPGFDGALGGGSRDGFIASVISPGAVETGLLLGGGSWDYVDGAVLGGTTLIVAGSFDAPFDVLSGESDFFIGALSTPF